MGVNFNGYGEVWSDTAAYRSCAKPSGVGIPALVSQSTTSLGFQWVAPDYDGGCEVLSYELWLDNKASGALEQTYTGLAHVRATSVTIDAAYVG